MIKKNLIIIFLFILVLTTNCASYNENNSYSLTPVLVQFENETNYDLFVIESINLPGRLSPRLNNKPTHLFFDFYGNLAEDEINNLFSRNITAICEYSIFNQE